MNHFNLHSINHVYYLQCGSAETCHMRLSASFNHATPGGTTIMFCTLQDICVTVTMIIEYIYRHRCCVYLAVLTGYLKCPVNCVRKCNEWRFRTRFCICKAILGRGQPGWMWWILFWIMPLVQDRSLDLLARGPAHYDCTTDAPILREEKTLNPAPANIYRILTAKYPLSSKPPSAACWLHNAVLVAGWRRLTTKIYIIACIIQESFRSLLKVATHRCVSGWVTEAIHILLLAREFSE